MEAPTNPEQREEWERDPAAFEAVERMHDAAEELIQAIYAHTNQVGTAFMRLQEGRGDVGELPKNEIAELYRLWGLAGLEAKQILRSRQNVGDPR